MPTSISSKKRVRQTEARSLRNKHTRGAMKTSVRVLEEAVRAGKKAEATAALTAVYQRLDKAAKRRVIHPNNAANQKARLARLVRGL